MTEQEWMIVTTAFTSLFDIVKATAPEKIRVNTVFTAGRILALEHDRILAKRTLFIDAASAAMASTGWNFQKPVSLQKQNEELEKKKQAQREELNDLTDTLKASIEKAEKDRQGE
jgi:hypothetical protein